MIEGQTPRGWYDVGGGFAGMWDGQRWTGERISHEQLAALTRPPAPPPPVVPPGPSYPVRQPRKPLTRRQQTISFAVVAGLVGLFGLYVVLGSVGVIEPPAPTKAPFAEAVERYQRDQPSVVERCCSVLTITLGRPDDPITAQRRREFGRLLADLGFTDGVVARMEGTRALDGTQTAEGRHARVTWTYHPDDGLRLVFEPK